MRTTLDPQSAEYLSLLKNLDTHEQELVIKMLRQLHQGSGTAIPSAKDALVEALAGRTFTHTERIQLELDSLFHYFQRRRQLLEGSLTASQVAKLLGTSRQTPHDRLKARTLLGVLDGGVLRFPVWQFDPQGPDGVIDGLPDVLRTLRVSDFAKLNWLVHPNPVLDTLTPVQALQQGHKERVTHEASGVGSL